MNSRQTAALVTIASIWGASFLFIKVLIDDGVEPLGVSAGRTLLGALVLVPLALRRGPSSFRLPPRTWAGLAILGLVQFAIPWTLFGIAEKHAPSGVASIANATNPLWAALLAMVFLQADRLSGPRAIGLGLGFAGVVVLMGGDIAKLDAAGIGAVLLMVLATMCYAASTTSIRRWFGHVPALPLAAVQVSFAALFLMPAALTTGAYSQAHFEAATWLSLAALGVFASGLSVALYMGLIHEVGPVRASVATYLIAPVGVLLGWLVLDESLGWNLFGGLACVIAGVALVQGVGLRRPRSAPRRRAVPETALPASAD
jgi:drug/metabolite transporter (DMT)-like permease